jgi:drug/metabolite transporter (DMT)-like permease
VVPRDVAVVAGGVRCVPAHAAPAAATSRTTRASGVLGADTLPLHHTHVSPPRAAALALCCGIFIFSIQDAIVKGLSGDYPVHEAVVIRSLTALPILILLVRRDRGEVVTERRQLLVRGLVLFVAYTCYYLALASMPLASVIALWFTGPLFIVALAGRVTGEPADLRAWVVVGIGFLGVLVTLRPSGGLLHPAAALPIGSAIAYAAAQLMARRLRSSANAATMAFYQNGVYLFGALTLAALLAPVASNEKGGGSLGFLIREWHVPTPRDLALLAVCGPIAAVASTLLSHAYRIAGAGVVAPFEYTAILWGTLWGAVVFGNVPAPVDVVGAALIIGSGLLAVRRTA